MASSNLEVEEGPMAASNAQETKAAPGDVSMASNAASSVGQGNTLPAMSPLQTSTKNHATNADDNSTSNDSMEVEQEQQPAVCLPVAETAAAPSSSSSSSSVTDKPPKSNSKSKAKKGQATKATTTSKQVTVAKKQKASVKAKKPSAAATTAAKAAAAKESKKKTAANSGVSKAKPTNTATKKKPATAAKGGKGKTTNSNKGKGKTNNKNANGTSTPANKKGAAKAVESPEPAIDPAAEEEAANLFSKHYREFERNVARLEKVDQFGFFIESIDPAPEEFVEDYSSSNTASSLEVDADAIPTTNDDDAAAVMKDAKSEEEDNGEQGTATTTNTTKFPSHPPYNWEMISRRREQGRYVLDIQQQEEQKLKLIADYLNQEKKDPESPKIEPRRTTLLHRKGVNWDLFREDVIGMCDSMLERNAGNWGDGTTGSLIYAVKKIKGVSSAMLTRRGSCLLSPVQH